MPRCMKFPKYEILLEICKLIHSLCWVSYPSRNCLSNVGCFRSLYGASPVLRLSSSEKTLNEYYDMSLFDRFLLPELKFLFLLPTSHKRSISFRFLSFSLGISGPRLPLASLLIALTTIMKTQKNTCPHISVSRKYAVKSTKC